MNWVESSRETERRLDALLEKMQDIDVYSFTTFEDLVKRFSCEDMRSLAFQNMLEFDVLSKHDKAFIKYPDDIVLNFSTSRKLYYNNFKESCGARHNEFEEILSLHCSSEYEYNQLLRRVRHYNIIEWGFAIEISGIHDYTRSHPKKEEFEKLNEFILALVFMYRIKNGRKRCFISRCNECLEVIYEETKEEFSVCPNCGEDALLRGYKIDEKPK